MSSPDSSVVRKAAGSLDSPRSLGSSSEEGASTLRKSEVAQARDKSGTNSRYEVIIPDIDDRAHRPPTGFHTFYLNQVDMGLRFPIPRFIVDLCNHLGVSASQLAPNSYSYLLSLGILRSYFEVPLSNYTLMQLIQFHQPLPGTSVYSWRARVEMIDLCLSNYDCSIPIVNRVVHAVTGACADWSHLEVPRCAGRAARGASRVHMECLFRRVLAEECLDRCPDVTFLTRGMYSKPR
ncbi:hypothetical protein F511_17625 [Dorcoceras hygrometricum]|uniref:Uncharacterized protein n=1 Tax=Dorcoceras hygrometricum TaxID=472368 RepID=A0A2Z7AKC1_9LAMI|nr:hypothetical protein F511_17625 [Dorcoceras hygrometricum]